METILVLSLPAIALAAALFPNTSKVLLIRFVVRPGLLAFFYVHDSFEKLESFDDSLSKKLLK